MATETNHLFGSRFSSTASEPRKVDDLHPQIKKINCFWKEMEHYVNACYKLHDRKNLTFKMVRCELKQQQASRESNNLYVLRASFFSKI